MAERPDFSSVAGFYSMTLTINIDDVTQQRLEAEAHIVGKSLEEYITTTLALSGIGGPITPSVRTEPRRLGWAAGRGMFISNDFDEPLKDFKDYMHPSPDNYFTSPSRPQ